MSRSLSTYGKSIISALEQGTLVFGTIRLCILGFGILHHPDVSLPNEDPLVDSMALVLVDPLSRKNDVVHGGCIVENEGHRFRFLSKGV